MKNFGFSRSSTRYAGGPPKKGVWPNLKTKILYYYYRWIQVMSKGLAKISLEFESKGLKFPTGTFIVLLWKNVCMFVFMFVL